MEPNPGELYLSRAGILRSTRAQALDVEKGRPGMEHGQPTSKGSATLQLMKDYSLEMTGKDVRELDEAGPFIPTGTKVNVTFLGNEDQQMRVSAAKRVKELGLIPVPHISARRLRSQQELEEFLRRLQEIGATESVFCVGGDPAEPEGPYPDSLSIIRSGLLHEYGVREVSVAGYPEGHPDIADDVLWQHLEKKIISLSEQGFEAVILSQFSFDATRVWSWVKEVRGRGIDPPIRIGTPGPASIKRLLSYARRFGVGASSMIVKKYGFSLANLLGTAGPERFVTELAQVEADGASTPSDVGIHFYTFGGVVNTSRWINEFVMANERLADR